MKILKRILPLIIFLSANLYSHASHLAGATIWYKNVGKYKYEIYYEFYRDCRGIPFNSPTVQLRNAATGSNLTAPSYTLIAMVDITPYCKKASKPCYPSNQTISSSGPAFEKHTFKATVDMNSIKAAGVCQVQIGAGQCCRNGAITTGASGNDFWVWSMVDLCKASNNSSPVLAEEPPMVLNCGSLVKHNPAASDYTDNDSLAYELVDPYISWSGKTSWAGSYNSQNPFAVYWPSGYNKSKGPDPAANPPIGFYFNKLTGDMIFTPMDCSETSICAMRISEYRKDSATGKYELLGYITRDFETVTQTSTGNNVPLITANESIYIADNIKTCFTISSTDAAFKPTPNDTTTLSMFPFTPNKNTSVTFTVLDTRAKLKKAEVCWEPKGQARNQPYQMVFKVMDNNCNLYGASDKSINVYVVKSTDIGWVEGTTYYDRNQNCSLDSNEAPMSNQKIVFGPGNSLLIESDSSGKFDKAIPAGNYTFKFYDKNAGFVCSKTINIVKGNRYKFDMGAAPKMHITGTLYRDSTKNCKFETAEPKWGNHLVYTEPGNYMTSTDASGKYDLKIPAGDYKIKYRPAGSNFFVKCTLPSVSAGADTLFTGQNIAIYDSANITDASSRVISTYSYRRGADQEITIVVKNNGSRSVTSGNLWFKFNKKLKYVSSSSYVLKTDSTIKWDYTNLNAGNEMRFYAVLNADASTCQLNDTMTLFSWLDTSGISKDMNLSNNYDSHKIKIVSKTDPNIKQEFLSNGYTWREGNKLRYYIQFRNTGTKTISNVTVTDSFSYPISGSSFQMLGASHANTYSITNNVLKVNFTGINLPDSSSDKIKSKGYFEFSAEIDSRTNAEIKFYNRAQIYFDTAKAINTNKFYNTYTSYVSTGKTNATSYCFSDTLKVSYSSKFQFNSGNKFKLILSNTEGGFDYKTTVLDSISSTSASGSFKVKIPNTIAGGLINKVKVVSTNPYSAELSNGVSNSFKIFATAYKPSISTKDTFICNKDSIAINISAVFDTVKIYDRKTLIAYIPYKPVLKLKLPAGKHYLTASSNVSSACILSSDTLIIRNDTVPVVKLVSLSHPSLKGCRGDTVTLMASGSFSYTLYNNKFDTIVKSNTGVLKFTSNGNIQVVSIGKSKNGCSDTSNSLTFIMYSKPSVVFYSSATKLTSCKGENVIFQGTGAGSYQFYKNKQPWLKSFTDTIWTKDLKDGDSIRLEGTNSLGGCKGTTMTYKFTVVSPKTVLSCTDADLTLCNGTNSTSFNFSGASTYKLYKNGSFYLDIPGSTWNESGIKDNDVFYAEGTSAEGCKSISNQLQIRVKKSVVSMKVNPGKLICDGDSIIFELSGGLSYDLYKNSTLWQNVKGQRFAIRSMTQNDKVYATGTDSFGCTANSTTFTFSNILKSPVAVINDKDPDNTHCQGDLVGLKLSGGLFFQLYKNNILWKDTIGTDTDFKDLKDQDELYAWALGTNGCRGKSNTVKFTILPLPAKPVITRTGNSLFSSYSSGNQWFNGLAKISGAIDQKYTPTMFASYSVQYTDMNGCSSMSDKYNFTSAVPRVDLIGLKVYPNPATDHITIETGEAGHYKVKLTDITGRLINEAHFIGKAFEWNFKAEKGIYQLTIANEKGQSKTQTLEIN